MDKYIRSTLVQLGLAILVLQFSVGCKKKDESKEEPKKQVIRQPDKQKKGTVEEQQTDKRGKEQKAQQKKGSAKEAELPNTECGKKIAAEEERIRREVLPTLAAESAAVRDARKVVFSMFDEISKSLDDEEREKIKILWQRYQQCIKNVARSKGQAGIKFPESFDPKEKCDQLKGEEKQICENQIARLLVAWKTAVWASMGGGEENCRIFSDLGHELAEICRLVASGHGCKRTPPKSFTPMTACQAFLAGARKEECDKKYPNHTLLCTMLKLGRKGDAGIEDCIKLAQEGKIPVDPFFCLMLKKLIKTGGNCEILSQYQKHAHQMAHARRPGGPGNMFGPLADQAKKPGQFCYGNSTDGSCQGLPPTYFTPMKACQAFQAGAEGKKCGEDYPNNTLLCTMLKLGRQGEAGIQQCIELANKAEIPVDKHFCLMLRELKKTGATCDVLPEYQKRAPEQKMEMKVKEAEYLFGPKRFMGRPKEEATWDPCPLIAAANVKQKSCMGTFKLSGNLCDLYMLTLAAVNRDSSFCNKIAGKSMNSICKELAKLGVQKQAPSSPEVMLAREQECRKMFVRKYVSPAKGGRLEARVDLLNIFPEPARCTLQFKAVDKAGSSTRTATVKVDGAKKKTYSVFFVRLPNLKVETTVDCKWEIDKETIRKRYAPKPNS